MLLSRKLFNELFPIFKKVKSSDLENMLNCIGVEVESIFKYEKINNLTTGIIKKVYKHPDSIFLNICEVFFENKNHIIVCGANNVKKNIKVIVAKIGAKLPDGRIIEKKQIKNVFSEGMICAYNELTKKCDFLEDEQKNKIIELDSKSKVSDKNPLKYIGLDDEILTLSIPSNRNELNGIIGLGFDLIAVFYPKIKNSFDLNFKKYKKSSIKIKKNKDISSFFGLIEFDNFKMKQSTWRVKSFLMNSGIKPVNFLVDISNLCTIITGNPSHCYDKKYIGDLIEIDKCNKKNDFVALNNEKYKVSENDIVIKSKNKIISLAGIIGSKESSIKDDSTQIVCEIANFDNFLIKNTSERINLKTNASILFSKKIPLWITLKTFDLFIELLNKSDLILKGINYTGFGLSNKIISFNFDEIRSIIGDKSLTNQKITKILTSMDFVIKKNKEVIVPIYREDIETLADVVEEILKKININNLKDAEIDSTLINFETNEIEDNKSFLENYLINKGFNLVKTLNLTSFENNTNFNLFNTLNWIKIKNPISSERTYFRNNLIQQHLDVFSYNSKQKNSLFNIFEIQGLNYDNKWNQHLCISIIEPHYFNKVNNDKITKSLLFLKDIIFDLSRVLNFEIRLENNDLNLDFLLKNNSIKLISNNEVIGYCGQINPEIIDKKDIKKDVYFIEIKIENLIKKINKRNIEVKKQKSNHNIIRYLTITISENTKFNDLFNLMKQNSELIRDIQLESVFKKEDKISYNFSFSINEDCLTSKTNDEINEILNRVIKNIENSKINALIKK